MIKATIGIILKVLICTGLFLAANYPLFLYPKLLISNALINTKRTLSTHYYALLQNRLSYMGLTKLDLSSGNFEDEKSEIIGELQKTNEDGLKNLENPKKLEKVNSAPREILTFLNKDISTAYPSLIEKNKKVYEEKNKFIESLKVIDSTVSKLFAYQPETDFGTLDTNKDKEQLLESITSAKSGLKKIQENLQKLDQKNVEMNKLIEVMDRVQFSLTDIETGLRTNNNTSQKIRNLYNQFSNVKNQALLVELSVIRSDESVKLLTDQTNLILEYEYWLGKINGFQEKI